jgi:D-aminopeptidase
LSVEGLAAADWAALFIGYTAADVGSTATLDSGILGSGVLLVAVNVGFLGASVYV